MDNRAPSKSLQDIASETTLENKNAEFESSYKRLMKDFTRGLYEVPASVSNGNKNFIRMTIIDATAGQLVSKNREQEAANHFLSTASDIETCIQKLRSAPTTRAYEAKYMQDYAPLKADTKLRDEQQAEFTRSIGKYIELVQTKLPLLGKETAESKSRQDILTDIAKQLKKEQDALLDQGKRLGLNVQALQTKLDNLHHEVFIHLPPEERAAITPPAKLDRTPSSNRLG